VLVLAFAPAAFTLAALGTGLEQAWTPEIWRHTCVNALRIFCGGSVAIWAFSKMSDINAN
jgi:hypothetical protein